ncbi:hypothetical protein C8R45DRAFT_1110054 [Mycena sanguinolenta]|nr:hypothetical protein C8R45DRAFT_1110054 [Mycena sanguinolenta]
MAKEVPTTGEEFSVALNNSGHYLQPFAEAIRAQYGMNVAILLCGPIPENGGRIEVRSVHAGFSNGLVPRIWSDFDRAGFDSAQRSFIAFTQNCFTEEECRARALSDNSAQREGEDAELTTTSIPFPLPLPENAGTAQPDAPPSTMSSTSFSAGPASSPAWSGANEDPPLTLLPPSMDSLSRSLMPLPGADAAWDALMNDGPPGGWSGGDEGLDDWGLGLDHGGDNLAYMARLAGMSKEEVERENELAMQRAEEHEARVARFAPPTLGGAPTTNPTIGLPALVTNPAATNASNAVTAILAPAGTNVATATTLPTPNPATVVHESATTSNPTTNPATTSTTNLATTTPTNATAVMPATPTNSTTVIPVTATNATTVIPATPTNATTEKDDRPRPKPKPAWRKAGAAGAVPEGNGGDEGDEGGDGEGNKNAADRDGDREQTGKDAGHGDENAGWEQPDEDTWPNELRAVYRALQRGVKFGGEVGKTCAHRLIDLERVSGFPEKGLRSAPAGTADQRPEEVPAFIKRARKWEKRVPLGSTPGPVTESGSFAERWWTWWVRAQLGGRFEENGKMKSPSLLPEEDWEEVAKMAGKNGLLIYVGALLWWGEAAAEAADGADELLADWKLAVGDVADVLAMAIEAKSSSDDGAAEENGVAIVGQKRKAGGDKIPTSGKENANPRKHRRKTV